MPNNSYDDFVELARARGFVESAIELDAWAGFQATPEDISMSAFLDKRMNTHPHELRREPNDKAPELYSLAAQSKHVHEHGVGSLQALMQSNGMKVGQLRSKPKAEEQSGLKGANNPYSPQWHGTPEARQAKIKSLITSLGTKKTDEIAHAAGCTIDGSPLRPTATSRRWG